MDCTIYVASVPSFWNRKESSSSLHSIIIPLDHWYFSDGVIHVSAHRESLSSYFLVTSFPPYFIPCPLFRQFSFEKLPTPLKPNSQRTALKLVAVSRKVQNLAKLHSLEDLTRMTGTEYSISIFSVNMICSLLCRLPLAISICKFCIIHSNKSFFLPNNYS